MHKTGHRPVIGSSPLLPAHRPLRLSVAASAIALGVASAQLCPIPLIDDVDSLSPGPLAGQGSNWTIDEGDPQVVDGAGVGATAAIDANGDDLCVLLDGAGSTTVWTDFRLQPKALAPGTAPTPAGDTAAAFFFNTDGELEALDGTTWMVVATGLDLDALHRITIRTDYTAQQWTLWLNDDVVASDFGFANPVAAPAKFRSNRAARLIDDVRVHTFPLADGYTAWKSGFAWQSPGTDDQMLADPDLDGFDNLLEYVFVSNPLTSVLSGKPTGAVAGDKFEFTFNWNRAATDVSYQLQGSEDMATWSDIVADDVLSSPSADGVSDEITLRKNIDAERYFLRLDILAP